MKPSGIVTLLTDFGLDDAYVGAMKGAILSVHAKAAVVDITHGVGTDRRAIAFNAADHYFVGPDNGLFTFLNDPIRETVELATPPEASPTFHGRDVFAPVAAKLAAGAALAGVGRPHRAEPLRLPDAWASKVGEAWRAEALHCDHFGNVISNLSIRALARIKQANGMRVRTVETYEDAEPNELVALVGSSGRIEFALREGSAATRLHVAPGA